MLREAAAYPFRGEDAEATPLVGTVLALAVGFYAVVVMARPSVEAYERRLFFPLQVESHLVTLEFDGSHPP